MSKIAVAGGDDFGEVLRVRLLEANWQERSWYRECSLSSLCSASSLSDVGADQEAGQLRDQEGGRAVSFAQAGLVCWAELARSLV